MNLRIVTLLDVVNQLVELTVSHVTSSQIELVFSIRVLTHVVCDIEIVAIGGTLSLLSWREESFCVLSTCGHFCV